MRNLLLAGAALALGLSAGWAAAAPASSSAKKSTTPQKPAAKAPAKSPSKSPSKKTAARRPAKARVTGQRVPSPERIREIQSALATAGAYSGPPTGKFDERTIAAVKKFQQSNGLTPDGKIGAKTLQALGLGSEVAGLAPPRPPASPSSGSPN